MKASSQLKANLLCSLGILYFFLVPLLILALFAGIIVLLAVLKIHSGTGALTRYIFIPLGLVVILMFRGFFAALFTKLPEPEGLELTPNDAPRLYEAIAQIREKLKIPRIHSIRIGTGNDAYIVEQPRLGLIGFYRRYLVIGAPMLAYLDEGELSAVIAHECGHLAGAHGKTGLRTFRAQMIWERIAGELKKNGKDKYFFVSRFLYRYVPALKDAHFRVSRQYELDADAAAASVAGKRQAAQSLAKIVVWDVLLDMSFWPGMVKLNRDEDTPPDNLYTRMRAFIRDGFVADTAVEIMEKITSQRSLPDATHPSLSERLEAIGASAPPAESLAAAQETAFDGLTESCVARCSGLWKTGIASAWSENRATFKEMRARLGELKTAQRAGSLMPDESVERALLLEKLEGGEAALTAFRTINDANPDAPTVMYNLGRLMAYQGLEEGAGLLERAIERDDQAIPDCCYELMNYYLMQGNRDKAAGYYHYAVDFMKTNEEVKKERDTLKAGQISLEHDLSYESVMKIREVLSHYPKIRKAYIAKMNLELSGQFACYALCYRRACGQAEAVELKEKLTREDLSEWEFWLIDLNRHRDLEYIVDGIPNSRIL